MKLENDDAERFGACFLVKKLGSRHSSESSKVAVSTSISKSNSPCGLSSSITTPSSTISEFASLNHGFTLHSLLRNYFVRTIERKEICIPQVSVQGRNFFGEGVEQMSEETEHNSPRLSPRETRECSYSRTPEEDASSSVFVDNNRITQRPGITVKNNLLSPPKTLSCLEGRKVNIEFKIFDQRTLRRVERLKNLRTDEKKLVKDIYFPKTQGGKSQNVIQIHCAEMYNTLDSSNHSNASKNKSYSNVTSQAIHRNSRKYTEKRVFELPKVERYDILTRNIISSDACHVFKEKAVGKGSKTTRATRDLPKKEGLTGSHCGNRMLWRKTVFEMSTVQIRDPSPVQGLSLNPRKEMETIEQALKLVENSNLLANLPEIASSEVERLHVRKFVVRLPPIF